MLSFVLKFIVSHQWLSIILFLCFWYIYNLYKNNIWEKLGVYYLKPLPFVGNDLKLFLGTQTIHYSHIVKYNRIGSNRFAGIFRMFTPMLFVKDPDLIENIMVKDFHHFTDRGFVIDEKRQPLSGNLFFITGKRWKNLRVKLSPVFTSGKLKTMHQQIISCTDALVEVLQKNIGTGVNFKELTSQFTTDVIGSCAYGLNMNSLNDPDNQFRAMGRKIFQTCLAGKLKGILFMFLMQICPKLAFMMNLKTYHPDVNDFFLKLVPETIKARERNPHYMRNDFIQLLMNLRQKHDSISQQDQSETDEVHLDDLMLAANSFLFFIAGFETIASTLTYCFFELAQHPEIQENVYQEIKEVMSKHDGQVTYEAIKSLHYMDLVISETLRKYPPVPLLLRICTENYRIPDTNIILPKGQRIEIPVYALHHDPNIYADPENFVPERFSQENKDSIPKGAYLPFGDGPRICIGVRFAQMEIKTCLCKVLSKFRILKNPEMPDVVEFDPKSAFILLPKGGIYMNVVEREPQTQEPTFH